MGEEREGGREGERERGRERDEPDSWLMWLCTQEHEFINLTPFTLNIKTKMPRGGKTGGKLASSRSTSVYHRSSSVASSSRSQDLSGSVASVLAELQSLLVQTQVGGLYLE